MKFVKIALRNVNRQKRRTWLLAGAIAFCFMIITLVNGFVGGVVLNLQRNMAFFLGGHIYISQEEMTESEKVLSRVQNEELVYQVLEEKNIEYEEIVRRSQTYGELINAGNSIFQLINGVIWDEEKELVNRLDLIDGSLEETINNPYGLILTEGMVKKLDIQLGDSVVIKLDTITGQVNVGDLILTAIVRDSGIFGNLSGYANRDYINQLSGLEPDEYQSMCIMLKDVNLIDPYTEFIYAGIEDRFQVAERPKSEFEEAMVNARSGEESSFVQEPKEKEIWEGSRIKVENINDQLSFVDSLTSVANNVGIGLLVVLFLIIMVGISNTFRMIMYERIKEIGTMRSLGVQRKNIRSIFLYEGIALAIIGLLAGIVFSVLAGQLLSLFNFSKNEIMTLMTHNGHLTFKAPMSSMMINSGLIVVLTVLAVFIPAQKAAKLPPVEALRATY